MRYSLDIKLKAKGRTGYNFRPLFLKGWKAIITLGDAQFSER